MADTPKLFSGDALQKHIDEVVPSIPPDAKRVLVVYGNINGTVKVAYVQRVNKAITVEAIAGKAPKEGWTGEARLMGVWK